jgi:hypothetical protein
MFPNCSYPVGGVGCLPTAATFVALPRLLIGVLAEGKVNQFQDQWRPASDAVNLLTSKGYELDDAREIVLEMLATGLMMAKTRSNGFYFRKCCGGYIENINIRATDVIPMEFWVECAQPWAFRDLSWNFNVFAFDGRRAGVKNGYYGSAYDVVVDITPVESIKEIIPSLPVRPPHSSNWRSQNDGRTRGRPAANWWPDFAEELAMYCLIDELPLGEGTDGQSEVIETIFRRMAERGKQEPSRSSVQPVINAVLRRFRSAEK